MSSNGNNGWQMDPTNWITMTNGVFGTAAGQFTYVGLIYTDPPRVHPYSQYIAVTNVNGFYYLPMAPSAFQDRFDTNGDMSMYLLSAGYPYQNAWDPTAASNSWTLNRDSSSYLNFVTYPNSLTNETWFIGQMTPSSQVDTHRIWALPTFTFILSQSTAQTTLRSPTMMANRM